MHQGGVQVGYEKFFLRKTGQVLEELLGVVEVFKERVDVLLNGHGLEDNISTRWMVGQDDLSESMVIEFIYLFIYFDEGSQASLDWF